MSDFTSADLRNVLPLTEEGKARLAAERAEQARADQEEVIKARADLAKANEQIKLLRELAAAARELAQFASYAEIVGGVAVNRATIRKACDAVFAQHGAIFYADDESSGAW